MTVLEQLLVVAVFVLLCGIGLMRTHIKETGKLLARVQADHTAQVEENSKLRAEMIADTYRRTEQLHGVTARIRELTTKKEG